LAAPVLRNLDNQKEKTNMTSRGKMKRRAGAAVAVDGSGLAEWNEEAT